MDEGDGANSVKHTGYKTICEDCGHLAVGKPEPAETCRLCGGFLIVTAVVGKRKLVECD